jgi:L-ascorbate metabolism protein UlaG (beta-lactamase superfamily)
MRVTKFSHACLRFEHDGGVLVIDPGAWSERDALDGADAVLITHEHGDHLDVDALTDALGKQPSMRVFAPAEVVAKLADLPGSVTAVGPGQRLDAAGLPVRVYGGLHAIIHPDLPRVANLGYLVSDPDRGAAVYHPGDSFDVPADAGVDALFVPVSAPWLKMSEAIDFTRQVAPRRSYALHDGLSNDNGLSLVTTLMNRLSGTEFARLEPGQRFEV